MFKYEKNHQNVNVEVEPQFVYDHSLPEEGFYFFSYKVRIQNLSDCGFKLINRNWKIVDGNGMVETISGKGVVGAQPTLKSGEAFEYTSYCPLTTPTGSMRGHYEIQWDNGERAELPIPLFFLRLPSSFTNISIH